MNAENPKSFPRSLAADSEPSLRSGVQPHPMRGIATYALGLLILACMDSTSKYLAMRHPVPIVVALRYIVNFLLMLVLVAPFQGGKLLRTNRTGLVILRSVCLACGSLLLGFALQRMPVAEMTSILYLAPALVVIAAGPILGERKHPSAWLSVGAGIVGVVLIAHPGPGLEAVGVMLAFAGAMTTAGYQLLSRILAHTERTVALLFYSALVGAIAFTFMVPWFWDGKMPDTLDCILLVSLGFFSAAGHYLFTLAHRYAPASTLAPIGYLQVVWAGLLGWLVFDHVPSAVSFIGMAFIIASGVLILFKPGTSPTT